MKFFDFLIISLIILLILSHTVTYLIFNILVIKCCEPYKI